nr:DUF1120 domain-containing protein [uncultured Pseudomonas sp.]
MKARTHASVIAALGGLLSIASALAASDINLHVAGNITLSACTPTLGDAGVIDFGKIPAKDLAADSSTWLPTPPLQLQVNCAAPTLFALRGQDNRAGTAHKDDGYGLGLINGDEKLGTYLLTVRNPIADIPGVITLTSSNNGELWFGFPHGVWLTWNTLAAFGNGDSGVTAPVALTRVTADLLVETSIAPANGLSLDREVPLDGSATLELLYL